MRKTDKKIDQQLTRVLTQFCEQTCKGIQGFVWLTHLVKYTNFPHSLKVVCVFDTNKNLELFMQDKRHITLATQIESTLKGADVRVSNMMDHVLYDTEENCATQHSGQWDKRLAYSA